MENSAEHLDDSRVVIHCRDDPLDVVIQVLLALFHVVDVLITLAVVDDDSRRAAMTTLQTANRGIESLATETDSIHKKVTFRVLDIILVPTLGVDLGEVAVNPNHLIVSLELFTHRLQHLSGFGVGLLNEDNELIQAVGTGVGDTELVHGGLPEPAGAGGVVVPLLKKDSH